MSDLQRPWTIIIAEVLEQGKDWDKHHTAQVLRHAQEQIDKLREELNKWT